MPFTLCDTTVVPTPVLVAVQSVLRAILTTLAVPAERSAPLLPLDTADESPMSRRTIGSRQGSADRDRGADE